MLRKSVILITLFGLNYFACGTNIKWIPGNDGKNTPAASAPRSQKYWDEHNIERPDYAKTDEELAQGRGADWRSNGKTTNSKLLSIYPFIVMIVSVLYLYNNETVKCMYNDILLKIRPLLNRIIKNVIPQKKNRFSLEEEARMARLARFSVADEETETTK